MTDKPLNEVYETIGGVDVTDMTDAEIYELLDKAHYLSHEDSLLSEMGVEITAEPTLIEYRDKDQIAYAHPIPHLRDESGSPKYTVGHSIGELRDMVTIEGMDVSGMTRGQRNALFDKLQKDAEKFSMLNVLRGIENA